MFSSYHGGSKILEKALKLERILKAADAIYFKARIHERLWNNYTLPKSGKLLNFCQPNHISKLDRYFSFPSRFRKTAGYTENCSHQNCNQLCQNLRLI